MVVILIIPSSCSEIPCSQPKMSGHSQNSASVGHQRARPRLPGANLQPLVEAVLVGTRHPLRSQLAPPGEPVPPYQRHHGPLC